MASEHGTTQRPVDPLLSKLREEPYKFDFYQAMRMLERVFDDSPGFGRSMRLSDDPVRLSQKPSLLFAPASLDEFSESENGDYHKLSVRFFGLGGPNGALPLHLTEYVRDRIRHHDDHTLASFLDVFHHRMLSLFYRAWADAQPTVHYDRADEDRFSVYIGSLIGTGQPTLCDRDECPDLAKLYYAGRISAQTKNPEGLQAMLADFFGLPVQIEEFVGQWTELPNNCQFRLGEDPDSASLGEACTMGSHVWDCASKFRVTVGPLDWDEFHRMIPGGQSLHRLCALVRNYIGEELCWDLNLVLRHEETPSWVLGEGKLGQTVWLDGDGVEEDSRDLVLHS